MRVRVGETHARTQQSEEVAFYTALAAVSEHNNERKGIRIVILDRRDDATMHTHRFQRHATDRLAYGCGHQALQLMSCVAPRKKQGPSIDAGGAGFEDVDLEPES